jgi:hypothetical protein
MAARLAELLGASAGEPDSLFEDGEGGFELQVSRLQALGDCLEALQRLLEG